MDAQPFQNAALPDSGGGRSGTQERSKEKGGRVKTEEKEEDEAEKEEGSPSIKLGLGIDGNVSDKPVMKHGKCVLSTAQLHELQLQALIFKYIAGGIPVPVNLVMPIWKSVASAFGSAHGARSIYEQYPSFLGFSPQGLDYKNMIDPEPGRCRRTDGKKWRCSKNVIPDQKYCEQHIHRGCRRSRKPVEPSQIILTDSKLSKDSKKVSENSKPLSAPVVFQYMNPSSCNASTSHETTATSAMDSNNACSSRTFISTIATTAMDATTSGTIIIESNNGHKNNCKRNKNSPYTSENGEEKLSGSYNNIVNRSSKSGNKATVGSSTMSTGMGFSPKSVLQVLGCSNSQKEMELEPGRCRRTDGKRWRCSKDVIPDQKYCARHMHRGARRHVEVSQPLSIPATGDRQPNRLTTANKPACAALSTSLSISIPIPQLIAQDEKSSSSSETTISDTTITFFEKSNFP